MPCWKPGNGEDKWCAQLHRGSADGEGCLAGSQATVKTTGAAQLHRGSADAEECLAGSQAMVKTAVRHSFISAVLMVNALLEASLW
ncbi:hypothetical protein V3C99_016987 [Haemonchus contortus]